MSAQPLPRRPLARQLQDQPEYALWEGAFSSPAPHPSLQVRAERGPGRFFERPTDEEAEQ
ncbi:hypothetical protein ACODT3_25330 [Streptomyces sp. 4.24]|uniref:hypothetical protein n=1 Tax=Streptomyces tritrimontium TaxID=3406573 RepID=UPI003BB6221F